MFYSFILHVEEQTRSSEVLVRRNKLHFYIISVAIFCV